MRGRYPEFRFVVQIHAGRTRSLSSGWGHLDHAGASGWLARHGNRGQGANIYVHPNGAPHLLNPEKLRNSARRIYGEMMDTLWGECLAVPEDRLIVLQDQQEVAIDDIRFCVLDTPGHADHHFAYLFEDVCFPG